MNWTVAALGDLAEKIGSGSTPRGGKRSYKQSGIPLIRSMNVHDCAFKPDGLAYLDENQAQALANVTLVQNDVLLNITGASVARVCLLPKEYTGGRVNQHVAIIRPKPNKLCAKYLEHFLIYPETKRKLLAIAGAGATREAITKKSIEVLKIPLPSLDEQKWIATILDQADALRRLRQRAIDRLNTLGQSIFYEMFGDPATNPYGFEKCNLAEIIDFIGGSQPAKSNFLYEDGPGRVRFIQIRDFRTDEYKTYVPKHLAKRPFNEDDVMIGRYGPPVFQIFRGLSGTYNVALMKAAPKDGITNDFVFYLLQEHKLHSYVVANSERTAGQSGVNLRLLESYPAFKPPMKLQKEFSRRIFASLHLLNISSVQKELFEQMFSSLQQRAFRGEL